MGFKKDFVWGGASASYQIEGAAAEDGRLPSVWDMFCKQPGRVENGSSGDTACDHYHRWKEDIAIMKELGYKAYRFSVAWPRVIPTGDGPVNERGLAFYDRLVDGLLEAGLTPYVTLFHWDYPYALFRKGGWLNPESPEWFARYTEAVAKKIGDRVKHFITLNEPQCFIGLGYVNGDHAPGCKVPIWDALLMAHHVLLSHGRAVQVLRSLVPGAKIGTAPACGVDYPATPDDIEAARESFFNVHDSPIFTMALWNDPIFLGQYPAKLFDKFGAVMPPIGKDDMALIGQEVDFVGTNIYNGAAVRRTESGGFEKTPRKDGYAFTASKWPVTPEALYWGPRFLYERYRKPVYITENGLSCADVVSLDGKVHDPARIDFLHRYLLCLRRAADDGVDIAGYFHWCVTDNFEWAKGYTDRFGMVFCDYQTQQRIIKDSGYWYRDVIRSNGDNL
ncbi:MAG: beta-glucosidase [Treponema sp.]|jgi:beta-glucosidase|nr:beta-glucosidase [Treponema sp.]